MTNGTHIIHVPQSTEQSESESSSSAVIADVGHKRNKVVLDDSIEMEYDSEIDFRPKLDDGFEIKAHDNLSNNWPFKQNVRHFFLKDYKHFCSRYCLLLQANGDRAYKVESKGVVKEVHLSKRAVDGLITLNTSKRSDIRKDKNFLKALMIGVCSLARIREQNSIIEEGEKQFIQSLFEFRVSDDDDDGQRRASFDRLFSQSLVEFRNFLIH